MSQYAEEKRHFRIALVQETTPVAPSGRDAKWRAQFEEVLPMDTVPQQPRLVNVYKLGADPEFVLEDVVAGSRVDAEQFGLKTGLAFGADMNGRLVELRPEPSCFVLEVVASMLTELRWMALMYPSTRKTAWRAGAYVHKDGLGGHVHLGRKWHGAEVHEWAKWFNATHGRRPEGAPYVAKPAVMPQVIAALDLAYAYLMRLGVFPEQECATRATGDQHGQRYGQFGDIRLQAHGYEYRAFPSWMDSPWAAYFVLVLTKLIAYDPDLVRVPREELTVVSKISNATAKNFIRNILAYYKGRDDDAKLAYLVLSMKGLPTFVGGDFQPRWGLDGYKNLPKYNVPEVVPTSIAASADDVRELFNNLLGLGTLSRVPVVNWQDSLPKGYHVLLKQFKTTRGMKGIGELCWDIVTANLGKIMVGPISRTDFEISTELAATLSKDWRQQIAKIIPDRVRVVNEVNGQGFIADIGIPLGYREPAKLALARKVLISGVFPLWSAKTVTATSYEEWVASQTTCHPDTKVLFQGAI